MSINDYETKTTDGKSEEMLKIKKTIEKDKHEKEELNDKGDRFDNSENTKTPNIINESDQLLGQFHSETMIDIGGNILCTKKKYDQGRSSGDATTMARHMIDGIFKREAILRCTLTGQPPRAQGKNKRMEKVEAMDFEAKEQIIGKMIKIFTNKTL